MRITVLSAFLLIAMTFATSAREKSFQDYYSMSDFYHASPGAFKFGLYGYQNPAINSYLHSPDMTLAISNRTGDYNDFDRWGIFTGASNFGLGFMNLKEFGGAAQDYRVSFSGGDRNLSFGMGYGFVGGDKSRLGLSNILYFGGLYRPIPQFSVAASQTFALDRDDRETVVEVAVRPIGSYPLSIFADAAMFDDDNIETARWSYGASWEVIDGFRVNGRFFSDHAASIGIDYSLGDYGYGALGFMNDNLGDDGIDYGTFFLRSGALDRTVVQQFIPMKLYAELDLKGSMKYQSNKWFDDSKTLLRTLLAIEEAGKNKSIKGIVVNLSGASINKDMLWEIREALRIFKKSGKKVYVFTENLSMESYHFASVADEIILDPLGTMTLEGYLIGKSYYKGMFDKVGIGVQEFRYFKYKSAVESFARESMSEADREQLQALLDSWYETAKKEIDESRNISPEEFDEFVNGPLFYSAEKAKEEGLIDRTGRWLDKKDVMEDIDPKFGHLVNIYSLESKPEPFDDSWSGDDDNIAVVYAIGACAMESGIKARKLAPQLKAALSNSNIKAIVLRVDSPGGSAMASDYIAELVRDTTYDKPIIVSQGFLAASGGYWLSMDADKIVSAPITITGSIGVIANWIYDKGLKDTLGINAESVEVGKYADLMFSWSLPIVPLGLPVRKMNEEEEGYMENMIKIHYDEFVGMVARGRGMDSADVKEVAQGRVWTGADAKEIGLVDELGGFTKAIAIAKEMADIPANKKVNIFEMPEPELLDFQSLAMGALSLKTEQIVETDKLIEDLKFRLENNGRVMPILPLEFVRFAPEESTKY